MEFLVELGLILNQDTVNRITAYQIAHPGSSGAFLPLATGQEDIYLKGFSSKDQSLIISQLGDFRNYLQSLGYNPPTKPLKVEFSSDNPENAFYELEERRIVIGCDLLNMPDILFREYMHGVLAEVSPSYWTATGWKVTALGNGLADYFPCSYLGDPKFGKASIELFRKLAPL